MNFLQILYIEKASKNIFFLFSIPMCRFFFHNNHKTVRETVYSAILISSEVFFLEREADY